MSLFLGCQKRTGLMVVSLPFPLTQLYVLCMLYVASSSGRGAVGRVCYGSGTMSG